MGKSMARENLKTLYHDLRESRFDFVPRGEHNIRDVYTFVKDRFPELCDDSYLCSENCKSGYNSPEWKHKVRTALWDLKRHANDAAVAPYADYGYSVIPNTMDHFNWSPMISMRHHLNALKQQHFASFAILHLLGGSKNSIDINAKSAAWQLNYPMAHDMPKPITFNRSVRHTMDQTLLPTSSSYVPIIMRCATMA